MNELFCDLAHCSREGIACSIPGRITLRLCARHALDLGFCPLCGFHQGMRKNARRFGGACGECAARARALVRKPDRRAT